ncbi:hypothetical protein EON81_02865 [bacterium]|nr:MAG: hypothetical protein EON81_02865 [bacterium]
MTLSLEGGYAEIWHWREEREAWRALERFPQRFDVYPAAMASAWHTVGLHAADGGLIAGFLLAASGEIPSIAAHEGWLAVVGGDEYHLVQVTPRRIVSGRMIYRPILLLTSGRLFLVGELEALLCNTATGEMVSHDFPDLITDSKVADGRLRVTMHNGDVEMVG